MQEHAVSLDLSQQLVKAGFCFKTEHWWQPSRPSPEKDTDYNIVCANEFIETIDFYVIVADNMWPAPIATELLNHMKPEIGIYGVMYFLRIEWERSSDQWLVSYSHRESIEVRDKNLPTALAKLWLLTVSKGYEVAK